MLLFQLNVKGYKVTVVIAFSLHADVEMLTACFFLFVSSFTGQMQTNKHVLSVFLTVSGDFTYIKERLLLDTNETITTRLE